MEIQHKAKAIATSIIPRPSVYSHPDEWTYLENQLVWAIQYCHNILQELDKDKTFATDKWNAERKKSSTSLVAANLIQACLDETFTVTPQKSAISPDTMSELRYLAHLDNCQYYGNDYE